MLSGNVAEVAKGIQQRLSVARSPDLLLQSAQLAMQARDFAGARRALLEAQRSSPQDPRLLRVMVQSYVLEHHTGLALRMLREYAAHWPQSAEASFQLAQLLAQQGDRVEAQRRFQAMVEREAYELDAQLWLANLEERARNYPAAIDGYRRVLGMNSKNVVALNNLAYLLTNQGGELDEALRYAEEAQALAPDNPDVEGTLGWVLYRKHLYENAVPSLKHAAQKDGADNNEAAVVRKYHLGLAYLKTGERNPGVKLLASALATNARLPEAEMARQALAAQ
jgi:tetratricopeptide (TPR) repeat protein